MAFLCDRPSSKVIDFEHSRFVVANCRGLELGDRVLQRGDEILPGTLPLPVLKLEYEHHRIELVKHAKGDALLSEACALRGTRLEDPPAVQPDPEPPAAPDKSFADEFDGMARKDLVAICEKRRIPAYGTRDEILSRLRALVG